jgi:hypothetical protein
VSTDTFLFFSRDIFFTSPGGKRKRHSRSDRVLLAFHKRRNGVARKRIGCPIVAVPSSKFLPTSWKSPVFRKGEERLLKEIWTWDDASQRTASSSILSVPNNKLPQRIAAIRARE